MAKPLLWNSPGNSWNQPGLVWNGVAASTPKMSNIKASIDFTGYTAADLAPVAQMTHDGMASAAATFPAPPVTMAALQTLIGTFNTKLAAASPKASAELA